MSKLTFNDYRLQSVRTLPVLSKEIYKGIRAVKNKSGQLVDTSVILDRLHCAVGVVTETHELFEAISNNDRVNISEELSDKLWYLSALFYIDDQYNNDSIECFSFSSFKLNWFQKIYRRYFRNYLKLVTKLDFDLLDSAKKEFAYLKQNEIDRDVLCEYLYLIYEIAYVYDIDIEKGMYNNIEKLKQRFPQKFSIKSAIERDLNKERVILEK